MAKKDKKEVVIIGAGPGGYAAAFRAADLGLKVTLIGTEVDPGGTCLFYGCIPAKTILELLEMKEEIQEAEEMGLEFEEPEIDLEKLAKWKSKVVNELTEGIGLLSKERNVEYIQGEASFLSENEIEVRTSDGEKHHFEFRKAIIATGSVPRELPDVKFDHEKIVNSTDALEFNRIPGNLLIIGGGYIAPELGSVYAALGSKVSLVEVNSRILSWVDEDLVKVFQQDNKGIFEEEFYNSEVESITVQDEKTVVKFKNKEGSWKKEYDLVLVAAGRIPNTSKLRLDKAGIEKNEKGFIAVDAKRKTSRHNIYAIGDVVEEPLFANKATHEGRLAAEIIAGKGVSGTFNPKAIPSVVSTIRTEMAWCGLMETEAQEKGVKIKVAKFPWSASGRAASMGQNNGLTKLIFDKKNGKILGGGVVGKRAGGLISEIAMAVEMGATAKDICLSIHPHPSLSETIMEAAELFSGNATHLKAK